VVWAAAVPSATENKSAIVKSVDLVMECAPPNAYILTPVRVLPDEEVVKAHWGALLNGGPER
jgi:hypothetical protein